MSIFTPAGVSYLRGHRLGRMATVDAAGKPHAVPVGYRSDQSDTITIGGHRLDRSKKWRDLHDNPHVAFVVDDLVSVDPWRPRGVEIRGRAALHGAGGEQIGPGFGAAVARDPAQPHRLLGHRLRALRFPLMPGPCRDFVPSRRRVPHGCRGDPGHQPP